ncbi:uncharacterized protein LOC106942783 [Poecilia latipinna]|uniref:uncharacterized protein LOC106942783 n=1 Tax=Poecilia latipinna TaxID=48699 RepID=UPI00072EDFAF|nr:PREDICTED: uncharacterized protein LOC106942783 [Poecilia latipinna]
MWFHIPKSIFKSLGGLDFLLKCDFELTKIPILLSNFHKQVLHFWKMVFTHNFTPHGSIVWNNRSILINRKSIFKTDWYEKGILFVTDLMGSDGLLLNHRDFIIKFNLNCSCNEYLKLCKAIPVGLIHLIQNTLRYSKVAASLPKLKVGEYIVTDRKCNNALLVTAFKSKFFNDYNNYFLVTPNLSIIEKAFSMFVKWPLSPKVKETHFKISHNIYPVAKFLHKRFKFDLTCCAFCECPEESLNHLFFSCPFSSKLWGDIKRWLSLKIDNIPEINISHVLYYVDGLDSKISDMVNIVFCLLNIIYTAVNGEVLPLVLFSFSTNLNCISPH